jgi:glutaminyl-tRNA synthetase
VHPHTPERGERHFDFSGELWIERDDFQEVPEKGFHRLFVGNRARLKYGYVIECTGFKKDDAGHVTEVHATYFEDSKSGSPTSGNYKTKAVLTWVSATDAASAQVRLYDRLFSTAQPGAGDSDFLADINPSSLRTVQAFVEPGLAQSKPDDKFQFERHGYFVADLKDHSAGGLVFNRITSLKDSWAK